MKTPAQKYTDPKSKSSEDGSDKSPGMAMLVTSPALVTNNCRKNSQKCIIYSACTSHVCTDRESFIEFSSDKGTIQVGNKEYMKEERSCEGQNTGDCGWV